MGNDILDKIKKLRATGVSLGKGGHAGGAELYAAKAQDLLIKHKITLAELERSEALGDDPIGFEVFTPGDCPADKRCWWAHSLAVCVGKAHFCIVIGMSRTSDFKIVGRSKDREIALYMFDYLSNVMQILELLESQKLTGPKRGFKDSYYSGFISGVREKYEKAMRKAKDGEGGTALVVCSKAVEDWAHTKFDLITSRSRASFSGTGFGSGKEAGKSMDLGRRGVPAPRTKRIT